MSHRNMYYSPSDEEPIIYRNMNIPKRTTSQPKLDIETLKSIGKIKEAKLKSIPEVEKELDLLVTIEEQNDNDLSDVLQPTISKPHKKPHKPHEKKT